MRVSAINNTSINFQGLWRKSSQKTDFDKVMQIIRTEETYYYHPFSNETQEDIRNVVATNSSADIDEKSGNPKYIIHDCKVCSTLPIEEKDFIQYSQSSQTTRLNKLIKRVHKIVQGKYVNPDLNNQQSAVNEEISKRFKATA